MIERCNLGAAPRMRAAPRGPAMRRPYRIGARPVRRPVIQSFPRTRPTYLDGVDELGFSLKPPKWLKKAAATVKKNVTLKRALVAGAIVGAAFIPGVAPLVAKGVVGAGKLAVGGGKLLGRGVVGAGRLVGQATGIIRRTPVPGTPGAPAAAPDVFTASGDPATVAAAVTSPAPAGAPDITPAPSGGGGGGFSPPATAAPEQAGLAPGSNANILPLVLSGAALFILPQLMKPARSRRR